MGWTRDRGSSRTKSFQTTKLERKTAKERELLFRLTRWDVFQDPEGLSQWWDELSGKVLGWNLELRSPTSQFFRNCLSRPWWNFPSVKCCQKFYTGFCSLLQCKTQAIVKSGKQSLGMRPFGINPLVNDTTFSREQNVVFTLLHSVPRRLQYSFFVPWKALISDSKAASWDR